MGGHATHDEAEGRTLCSEEEFARWGARDPVACYESWLEGAGRGITRADLDRVESKVTAELDAAAEEALASREGPPATAEDLTSGVYAGDTPAERHGILVKG